MIDKVVYIGYMPLTTKVKKDFFFNQLLKKNIEVEYWDLTEIYFNNIFSDKLNDQNIFKINSYQLLKKLINAINVKTTLFVINITYGFRVISLFKILTNYNCKTAFFARGALPQIPNTSKLDYLNKIFDYKVLKRFIENQYALFLKTTGVIKHYDIVYRAGANGLQTIGAGSNIERKKSKIIDINYFDYDTYLYYKVAKKISQKKYCVFLDEYLPHHPDFKMFDIKTISSVEYYKKLNLFFDMVEFKFGFEVIIAAHPKAEKYKDKDFFNNRKVLFSKTPELVKDSEFVIAHCSSSIGFSVLNNKPIVSLIMNEMKVKMPNYYDSIKSFSQALDTKLINLDAFKEITIPEINEQKYSEYINNFLSSKKSINSYSSEIFLESINTFNRI